MSRGAIRFSALMLGLAIVGAAAGHHPPGMDRCQSFTFTGQIEQIEWRNPHVELLIRTDAGLRHRVAWLNVQRLSLAGINRDTLSVGDYLVVTAGTRNEIVEKPMLLSNIRRIRDGWEWSQVPQGC